MSAVVEIAAIEAAPCTNHVDIVFDAPARDTVRIRVDAPSGRAILAERSGLGSEFAPFIDLLRVVLEARGSRMTHVEISPEDVNGGRIFFEFEPGSRMTGLRGLPLTLPILIATHLDLPIHLGSSLDASPRPTPLPAAFQELIDQLGLGDVAG